MWYTKVSMCTLPCSPFCRLMPVVSLVAWTMVPVYTHAGVLVVSPSPCTSADSVTVQWAIDTSPVTCVPVYPDSFSIARLPGYPPKLTLTIDTRGTPPSRQVPCLDSPTVVGPRVEVGLLPMGIYSLMDERERVLGGFTVSDAAGLLAVGGRLTALWPTGPTEGTVAHLEALTTDSAGMPRFVALDSMSTIGWYFFGGLDTNTYRLTFTHPAFVTRTDTVLLPAPEMDSLWGYNHPVALLGDGVWGSIHGTVTDLVANPIPSCTVQVYALPAAGPATPQNVDTTPRVACTDSSGAFLADSLAPFQGTSPARYRVVVTHAGFDSASVVVILQLPGLDALYNCRLVPVGGVRATSHGRSVALTVRTSAHRVTVELAQSAALDIRLYDLAGRELYRVSPDGRLGAGTHVFALPPMPPSVHIVCVRAGSTQLWSVAR